MIQKLKPQVIFLQAGCDGLAKDPLGGWALSTDSLAWICEWMVGIGVPLLVVGGGGYVSKNAAKCWTLCTMAMNRKIQNMNGEKEKQYGSIPESPLEGECIMVKGEPQNYHSYPFWFRRFLKNVPTGLFMHQTIPLRYRKQT